MGIVSVTEFVVRDEVGPPTVHVVTARGIINVINSLDTEVTFTTLFPHKLKLTGLLSFIGKPLPTILASIPPFTPETDGVTEVITNGTVIAEIDAVLALPI